MLTNKEIYKILDKLGMVEETTNLEETAKKFVNNCEDIVEVTKFVDDLCTYNDLATIKGFLTCLFISNSK